MSIELIEQYEQELNALYVTYKTAMTTRLNVAKSQSLNNAKGASNDAFLAISEPKIYQGGGTWQNDRKPTGFVWNTDIYPTGGFSQVFSSMASLLNYAQKIQFSGKSFIAVFRPELAISGNDRYYVSFGTSITPDSRIIPKTYKTALRQVGSGQSIISGVPNHTYGGFTGPTWAIYPIVSAYVYETAQRKAANDLAAYNAFISVNPSPQANTSPQANIAELDAQITQKINALNSLVSKVAPKGTANRAAIDANYTNILAQYTEMKSKYDELLTELQNPELLKGNYEVAQLTTNTKYFTYILYIFFTIFIIGCLIYLYMFPEAGNLDMFILALAVIIIVYYTYDVLLKKYRKTIH